jgi:hypothetical protein
MGGDSGDSGGGVGRGGGGGARTGRSLESYLDDEVPDDLSRL